MSGPGSWIVTGALGFVLLLLGGCGFPEVTQPTRYAAIRPTSEFSEGLHAPAGFGPSPTAVQKQRPVRSLLEMRHEHVVIQTWDLSCGAAALATLLRYEFGEPVTEKEIARGLMARSEYLEHPEVVQIREGFSLLDLKRYVQTRGYKGLGLGKLDLNDLIERAPVMVPVDALGYNHFVIFRGIKGNRVMLADPAWGNRTMSIDKFQRMWLDYGEKIGHVGFVVERADGRQPPNRMQPKLTEFVMLQ
ncbi:MAG: C39 family peptidase [Stellaceae bacterium]